MSASPELHVRSFQPEDAETFWALRLRAVREHPEAFMVSYEEDSAVPLEQVRTRLAAQSPASQLILGAFLEGRLVGMVGLAREPLLKIAHRAHIWGMYVVPEVRGRGVGRRMLEEAIAAARNMAGVEQLHLSVLEGNGAASALYDAMGFQSYGVVKRSLRVGDRYYDEDLRVLTLQES